MARGWGRSEEDLEADKEQARSERLLLNVLPESIALRLKGGAEVIADLAEDATVDNPESGP